VGTLNAAELVQDRARALAEARAALPLLKGLPEHVGQKADEDVRLHTVGPLVPHGVLLEVVPDRHLDPDS
jgi:hypothetical protein